MSPDDAGSTAVVFLCGDASNGNITMCESSLFSKLIHEIAGDGDNLIALCRDGSYDLNTGEPTLGNPFRASHMCAGKDSHYILSSSDSVIYSWGKGSYGELGLGFRRTNVIEPLPIQHKASFSSISAGESHGAALDLIGNAYSWGQNFDRQLGLYRKEHTEFYNPNCVVEEVMFVPSLLPFSLKCPIFKISCGSKFTVAIGKNGDLWTWGAGECGQLGTGRCTRREVPTKVNVYTGEESNPGNNEGKTAKIIDIACGASHCLAVGDDGNVYSWGLNKRGQLGLSDTDTRQTPTIIQSFNLQKVYANGNSSAGINVSGELYTWGSGSKFRLMLMKETQNSKNGQNGKSGENGNGNGNGETEGDDSHRSVPVYVESLYGNIVHSFAFSRVASAALVISRLYEVNTN